MTRNHSKPRARQLAVWLSALLAMTALAVMLGGNDADVKNSQRTEVRQAPVENPFPNRPQVPEGILDGGTGWLNVSGPISMKDVRGKIVLFDFWTYCCINCMHILPDLKFLEKKYANELVVIGVHSAKFENEKDSDNIRQAILRYEIEHPVVNDSKMIIWRKFGVRAWPTQALVDPEGRYVGSISSEGHRELLDGVIGKLVAYHKAKGTLDRTPLRFDLERTAAKPTPLKFPGKVLADEKNNRLFISDSNHNRIVVSTLDGRLLDVIGNGAIGARNGSYDTALFDHPQGMTLVGETLYVADTENHLIRTVDLKRKTVSTLAGTGEQARRRVSKGKLQQTALNSPWALAHVDGRLYIAMAGPHQMWSHKLGSDAIGVYAGSGLEDITNGSLTEAALAQPSGVTTDGKFLYVVDSEGSAVRKIPLDRGGRVTTVVGTSDLPHGRALFEFGDVDGVGGDVRLQHPLGVVYRDGLLYVADSYNHKIKKVDLAKKEAKTWLGDGKAGDRLDPPRLSEPGGLSLAGGKLYIADTNNHRIAVADLKTGKLSVLTLDGLEPPKPANTDDDDFAPTKTITDVKPQTVASAESLRFEIALNLPEGYKLNKLAAVTYRLKADDGQKLIAAKRLHARQRAKAEGATATVTVPLVKKTGKATLELAVTYAFCRDGVGGLCKLKTASWRIPVEVAADGQQRAIKLSTSAEN